MEHEHVGIRRDRSRTPLQQCQNRFTALEESDKEDELDREAEKLLHEQSSKAPKPAAPARPAAAPSCSQRGRRKNQQNKSAKERESERDRDVINFMVDKATRRARMRHKTPPSLSH